MAWSTRQLADLAGTTVRAVRYYHEIGVLPSPVRAANGYKQYGVQHLVRLLRIRRLVDLGIPLSQVEASLRGGVDEVSIQSIRAEIDATIDRLQRMRGQLDEMAAGDVAAAEVPEGFGAVAGRMSSEERALMTVYSRLFRDSAMDTFRDVVSMDTDAADAAFAALSDDAPRAERIAVARGLAPGMRQLYREHPWMSEPGSEARSSPRELQTVVRAAVIDLYNAAQREVLYRAHLLATGQDDPRLDE